jgi:uncharacterized protein
MMWDTFRWLNEPADWQVRNDQLSVQVSPKTDFWRKTHYGFTHDSGHFFFRTVPGDFIVQVRFRGEYVSLYDQGGLMLRASEEYWMKCGIEYVDDVQQASVVVTNEYSDWSVTPLVMNPKDVCFRIKKQESSFEVFYSVDGDKFAMLRTTYLRCHDDLQVGIMCAAPQGSGFRMVFSDFSIEAASSFG